MTNELPAFTPSAATPITQIGVDPKPSRKKKATNSKAPKDAKAKKGKKVAAETGQRNRSMRVAPMTFDAATALGTFAKLSTKELEAVQTFIGLLNPHPRPARARMLEALQALVKS